MSAKKQLEKEIREAYIFLRENNMTVPSETLQFMLDASLDRLNEPTIAAAPELLEACLKLVQRLESDCPWWLLDNRDEIESAIKKALGGE